MKYMYFKLSTNKLKHKAVLILLLFMSVLVKAQSDFTMTPKIACSEVDLTQVNVIPGIPEADVVSYTVRWGIPNDTSMLTRNGPNPPSTFFSKIYNKGGLYTITLVVKRTSGPDIIVTKERKIWERPKTIITLASRDTQCFKNNNYCFNNLTKQGDAPLLSYEWVYADGNARLITDTNVRNVCHKYNLVNPTYKVSLTVVDSVGCRTDPTRDFQSVRVISLAADINPKFTITGEPRCDTTPYIYTNTTPLGFSFVKSFTWDFGDGTKYVSGPPNTVTQDFNMWTKSFTHKYTQNNVFYPTLTVENKPLGCADTFYYRTSGLRLPENIIYEIEILTKRELQNDTIADSVCFLSPQSGAVTLYNNKELIGKGGTRLDIIWNFNDPNATNPGVSDRFTEDQPTYKYLGMGQFYPTLTVVCPGLPPRPFVYNFYSKIDTLPKDKNRYQYLDYFRAPNPSFPTSLNPNSYRLFPTIPTRVGRYLRSNNLLNSSKYVLINYNGQISDYKIDTIIDPTNPTNFLGFYYRHQKNIDFASRSYDFFKADTTFIPNYWDTVQYTFKNPFTGFLNTVPAIYEYSSPIKYRLTLVPRPNQNDTIIDVFGQKGFFYPGNNIVAPLTIDSIVYFSTLDTVALNAAEIVYLPKDSSNLITVNNNWYKLEGDILIGMGVNVLGPQVRIEKPTPPPPVVILPWQKTQCGPTYPVDFVNTSVVYQSHRLWINWDFGENQYAPACTSYSIPNPTTAFAGEPPYTDAFDMQARTFGAFIANGNRYLGRYNGCNYSHDSLPKHQFTNWDKILSWYKYGHDFPPYDTVRWSKDWTLSHSSWPPPIAPPTGVNWVAGEDTSTWNKQIRAVGAVQSRLDTMVNIWPTDIAPNRIITLSKDIPDPISGSRGNWMDIIKSGTRIDTGGLLVNLTLANDKRIRRYRGSDTIPGIRPIMTLYEYAFKRDIIREVSVRLKMKDSLNNASDDPDYRQVKVKTEIVKIYDPITKGSKDSLITDSLFLDDWDCNGSNTVSLNFVRPDAFGLTQSGRICPGSKNGDFGGDAKLVFDNTGFLDTAQSVTGAGIMPSNGRSFLQINYDSLLDRNDLTPCVLDNFVPFDGSANLDFSAEGKVQAGRTRGNLVMPPMWNTPNYTPPPQAWTGPSGSSTFVHYYPDGSSPVGASPMPFDKKRGWITLGLVVGTGCATPTNCTIPDQKCGMSDTVWYHRFFRYISFNADFRTEKYSYENETINAKESFCYLRGKGDNVTFHYVDSTQDNLIADVWNWGDGTATIDSFYYQPNSDEPYNRIRYQYNTLTLPWTASPVLEYFPIGTRISRDTVIRQYYECSDINKLTPKYDTTINILDSSFMLLPITHKYEKSSFENMVLGGNNELIRKGDITEVQHTMISNTFSRCKSLAIHHLVIGVIDTFDILNSNGDLDTVFCEGETVFFRDSVRYWYPSSACSRPLAPDENFNDFHDHGNMHQWAYTKNNYPIDSLRPDITVVPWDYEVFPNGITTCPIGFNLLPIVSANDVGKTITKCYRFKGNDFFRERIYWDFESDGVIDHLEANTELTPGKLPNVSHKYDKWGRYKVSMISIDSTGRWDTCIQFVNVVKPIAQIASKDLFICGDQYLFRDSTIILDGYAASTGVDSLDRIAQWKWWFGDRKYFPKAPQSILKNPQYDYRLYGKYRVRLEIITEQGCKSEVEKDIILSGPRPHLILLDDTLGCTPQRVRVVNIPERESWSLPEDTFTKLTIIRSGRPDRLSYTYKYSVIDTAVFYYDQPGTFYITAEGYNTEDGSASACRPAIVPDTVDGAQKPIRIVINVPYKVDLVSSKDTVCVGEVFKLRNQSDRDTINRYRLDVFDAALGTKLDSVLKTNYISDTAWQYRFNNVGQYKLVLASTKFDRAYSPCPNHDTILMVAAKSKADFTATQAGENQFRLVNTSDTVISDKYTWKIYNPDGSLFTGFPKDFDEASNLNDFVQTFDIDSSRAFNVCIVADVAGTNSCPDSVCKVIQVIIPKGKINIPNVFTPNGDDKNDVFKIDIEGYQKYSIVIWNRWGNTVFESDNAQKMWNGKTNNDGGDNPAGTYYYLFTYQLRGEPEKTVRGSVTLIRQ
jgi:gliding motility-associated-like protein